MLHSAFLGRKNQKKRFFLSKSMPNFNFAKIQIRKLLGDFAVTSVSFLRKKLVKA